MVYLFSVPATASEAALSITNPIQGSTLTASNQLFSWNEGDENVISWVLLIGSTLGQYDHYVAAGNASETDVNITGLPADNSVIYARFWYETATGWTKIDSSYIATNPVSPPQISNPLQNSTLNSPSQEFIWNANNLNVETWALYVGDVVGAYNYYFYAGTATSTVVTGLPADGSTVYFRLWYKIDGSWSSQDITYTAASAITPPIISYPAPGSTLVSSNQVFNWNAGNEMVDTWVVYVGSTQGGYDYYFYSGVETNTVATDLPIDGSTIYIRLWYEVAGVWNMQDFVYTAAIISSVPIQILQLGDSITQAHVTKLSYRYHLWKLLLDYDINFDFIGTETIRYGFGDVAPWPEYLGQTFDQDHEGHSGWKADEIMNNLNGWLTSYTPDVVLIHLGTNDIFQDEDSSSSLVDLTGIVNILRSDNPNVSIFLAKILPTTWYTGAGNSANVGVNDLNAQLDSLASSLTTVDSPVVIVDMNEMFPISYLYDGAHPNINGDIEVAQRWFNAMLSSGSLTSN